MKTENFSLELDTDNIYHLIIDVANERVNTLRASFINEFNDCLDEIKKSSARGLIVRSGKADSFIAGADVHMIDACQTSEEAAEIVTQGQVAFSAIEALKIPVVAAIHGVCLGGGMELALGCHTRICTNDDKTQLGLPEVKLGLLPGSGGTQRLPSLVGLPKALELILTGKQLRAKQALKAGLVDDVVPHSILLETAKRWILEKKSRKTAWQERFKKFILARGPVRAFIFNESRKKSAQAGSDNYPAIEKIHQVINMGLDGGRKIGSQAEATAFGELALSAESKALRHIFFTSTALKKQHPVEIPDDYQTAFVGVLGGGLMGGGIASVTINKAGLPVRLRDVSEQGIVNALSYAYRTYQSKIKRRFMTLVAAKKEMAQLTGTTDYTGIKKSNVVIEAVIEDLAIKRQVLAEIEGVCPNTTIFASNTSSIPIGLIAEQASHPERVIGMHYFSPVEKMPLCEIVPHTGTSELTIARALDLAQKQGKTAIVVKDSAGFYVNRILAPYVGEALQLLSEGFEVERIDRALKKVGFPVGPLTLLDEVGFDIPIKMAPVMAQALGERFAMPETMQNFVTKERLGRKTKAGFYLYGGKSKEKQVNPAVATCFGTQKTQTDLSDAQIARRCMLRMLNEAAMCLEEGVIRSADDGDIGAIFGIGFPPFLGGPFFHMQQVGRTEVIKELHEHETTYGARFQPCQALLEGEL